jgi:hypothetical protein
VAGALPPIMKELLHQNFGGRQDIIGMLGLPNIIVHLIQLKHGRLEITALGTSYKLILEELVHHVVLQICQLLVIPIETLVVFHQRNNILEIALLFHVLQNVPAHEINFSLWGREYFPNLCEIFSILKILD